MIMENKNLANSGILERNSTSEQRAETAMELKERKAQGALSKPEEMLIVTEGINILLSSRNSLVRMAVADMLSAYKGSYADRQDLLERLYDALSKEKSELVRFYIIKALPTLHDPRVIGALENETNPFVFVPYRRFWQNLTQKPQ